ncbi:uncharacterized protein LOC132734916 [Ruditapes philippinarum]|uniref:uncharacterized protein LOC132734916 n=1 Tax=Ruditapes philippinarum TaxID=129788 RepID=UPI00295B60F2|nr:uncharacterized protein LOC132734916 [Ruditapes philippinarum]
MFATTHPAISSTVLLFLVGYVLAECPPYQVPHTVDARTICCQPVFNCPIDHEVTFCSEDGGIDTCTPCVGGAVNKFNTSSLDEEARVCFTKTQSHEDCPIHDTKPVPRSRPGSECDGMPCKCKTEECRYGIPCRVCDLKYTPCGINEELNESGDCVPCKPFMTSPAGCEPCQYNETLWRKHQETLENTNQGLVTGGDSSSYKVTNKVVNKPSVTMEKDGAKEGEGGYIIATDASSKNGTDAAEQGQGKDKDDKSFIIIVVVVIAGLLFCGLSVAFALYVRSVDDNSRLANLKNKFCRRGRNRYQTGQQDPERPNGDVRHEEETEFKQPTAAVQPIVRGRDTAEVTENGACGGQDNAGGADMALLKDQNEETREKGN